MHLQVVNHVIKQVSFQGNQYPTHNVLHCLAKCSAVQRNIVKQLQLNMLDTYHDRIMYWPHM